MSESVGKKAGGARPVIGWREWVGLPALDVPHIKAKVDTGARSSSLHAVNVQIFRTEGREMVRFMVHPHQRDSGETVTAEAPLADQRWVKSSGGHETLRPVIETPVVIGDVEFKVELTLVSRQAMGFRMLLGREALRRRFLVDAGRSYVLSQRPTGGGKKKPRKKKKKKNRLPDKDAAP